MLGAEGRLEVVAVGVGEAEGLGLVHRAEDVLHAAGAPLFQHHPAGALSSRLLLRSLLRPLAFQPPDKHTTVKGNNYTHLHKTEKGQVHNPSQHDLVPLV